MNECLGEFIMCQGLCLLLPLTLTRLTLTITLWERAVPLRSWGNCNTEKLGDSPDSLSWLRAALCLTLLPGPLTASGHRRAEYTEASPVFHLGVLSYSYPGIIGSAEPFRVLSVWFKAQTGFPPLFSRLWVKALFTLFLFCEAIKKQRLWTHLNHWREKFIITFLEMSSLGYKLFGSVVGEGQKWQCREKLMSQGQLPGLGQATTCPLPDFDSAGTFLPLKRKTKTGNLNIFHMGP